MTILYFYMTKLVQEGINTSQHMKKFSAGMQNYKRLRL